MKIKTAELTGTALDWAVAKCESRLGSDFVYKSNRRLYAEGKLPDGVITAPESAFDIDVRCLSYSTEWAQGGPIIEREQIATLCPTTGDFWDARDGKTFTMNPVYHRGSTPLIAAMRCYVASKLGNEVEIPEELL